MNNDPRTPARLSRVGTALLLALAMAALPTSCITVHASPVEASPEAIQESQPEPEVDLESALSAYYCTYTSGDDDLLISAHAKFDIGCANCHDQSNLDKWAAAEKDEEGFVVEDDYKFGRYSCLVCHDDDNPLTGRDLENIINSTILTGPTTSYNKTGEYNVHSNHRSEQDCSDCHSMHGQSVVSCTFCHELDSVPDGWNITFDYCG